MIKVYISSFTPLFIPKYDKLKNYQQNFINKVEQTLKENPYAQLNHFELLDDYCDKHIKVASILIPASADECNAYFTNNEWTSKRSGKRLVYEIVEHTDKHNDITAIKITFTDCSNHEYIGIYYPNNKRSFC